MERPGQAKRVAPPQVPAITHNGVRYSAPAFGALVEGAPVFRGGHVIAYDAASGKMLWDLEVYKIVRDPKLEGNVQDVFITRLEVRGDKLIVTGERGEQYAVDLKNKNISKLAGR